MNSLNAICSPQERDKGLFVQGTESLRNTHSPEKAKPEEVGAGTAGSAYSSAFFSAGGRHITDRKIGFQK